MLKRKWKGDPKCYFCSSPESVNHLLFNCSVAKVVWATVSTYLATTNIPTSFEQSWRWCERWIPRGKQFYAVGIAAVCWSIWKIRNKICFDGKKLHNPLEIVSHACALMKFWAGLQKEVDKEALIKGVETMFKIVVQLLSKKRRTVDQSNLLPDVTEEEDANQEPDC